MTVGVVRHVLVVGWRLHRTEGGHTKVAELLVVLDRRQFDMSCEGSKGRLVFGLLVGVG